MPFVIGRFFVAFFGRKRERTGISFCLNVLFLSPATRKERKETYFKWERKEFVMFVCSFLARVGKKRTKETPLKGEGCFKIRQEGSRSKIQQLCRIFCNPLKMKLGLLACEEPVAANILHFKKDYTPHDYPLRIPLPLRSCGARSVSIVLRRL